MSALQNEKRKEAGSCVSEQGKSQGGTVMSLLQAIFLGVVQGITEFLPVSSSGHLAIFQNIFGMQTDGGLLFDVCLHIGTLAAVFIVYWKDIFKMIREFFSMCADIAGNIKIFYRNRRYKEAFRYHRIYINNYRKFVVLGACIHHSYRLDRRGRKESDQLCLYNADRSRCLPASDRTSASGGGPLQGWERSRKTSATAMVS